MDVKSEKRRDRVWRLLTEGSEAKLQRYGTKQALGKLKDAYRLAIKKPELLPPLPQLAAYRYAHILLRSNPKSKAELEEIDDLFAKAQHAKSLRALPSLYRLAVIDRLRRMSVDEAVKDEAFVKARFKLCCVAVGKHLERDRDDKFRLLERDDEFRLQHGLVNMLELAAYFLCLSVDELEGMRDNESRSMDHLAASFLGLSLDALEGIRDNESRSRDHWYLVGPDPVIPTVRYSREDALQELDALQETDMQACVFCLPAEGKPGWRKSLDTNLRDDLRESTARLLEVRLRRPNLQPNQICKQAFGEEVLAATCRKARERFRQDLAELTDRKEHDFRGTGPGSIGLPPGFVVYGAIAERRVVARVR